MSSLCERVLKKSEICNGEIEKYSIIRLYISLIKEDQFEALTKKI